jgi:hypothetical protein
MKLTVSCQICGRIIAVAEKDNFSADDINMYQNQSSCEVDGPFQQYDGDGNPLPLDTSNIVVSKTAS